MSAVSLIKSHTEAPACAEIKPKPHLDINSDSIALESSTEYMSSPTTNMVLSQNSELLARPAAFQMNYSESSNTLLTDPQSVETIPIEQVPEFLKARGVSCSVDAALEALRVIRERNHSENADVSSVSPGEIDMIWAFMSTENKPTQAIESADTTDINPSATAEAKVALREWLHKWCRCFFHRHFHTKGEVYESQMKPTNKLLMMVVIISFFLALAVVGTAVGLIWTQSISDQKQDLTDIAEVVRSSVEFYSYTQVQASQAQDLSLTTSIMKNMIQDVAVESNMQNKQTGLTNIVTVMGGIINNTFLVNTEARQLNLVLMMSACLQLMCVSNIPNATIIQFVNELNTLQVQPGREFVLSQVAPNTTRGFVFLSDLYFKGICMNGACGRDPSAATPTRNALAGLTGTIIGNDYVPQLVFAAYTFVPCLNWGLVFKVPMRIMKQEFTEEVVNSINTLNVGSFNGTIEMMLLGADLTTGVVTNLTTPQFLYQCGDSCIPVSQTMLPSLFGMPTNSTIGVDYRSDRTVLISYTYINALNVTLLMKTDMDEIQSALVDQLGSSGSVINGNLNGSLEIRLAVKTFSANGTVGGRYITGMKYPGECVLPCSQTALSTAMYNAAVLCKDGQVATRDYRNQEVLAGYSCISQLGVGFVFKVDLDEVANSSLQQAVQYANQQNSQESSSLEIMVGESKPAISLAKSLNDIQILSTLRYASDRSKPDCWGPGSSATAMITSLNPSVPETGVREENDYRPKSTLSAWSSIRSLSIGLVAKVDSSEVQAPLLTMIGILVGAAMGVVFVGILVLAFAASKLLKNMVDTWERGKKAVEQQKETFGTLVAALYPKFASERLLEGETQIVVEVPDVSIMFSDISNFRNTVLHLQPTDLVEWLGYIFGVMDTAAEHFRVYKIKTIGDSYFAIAGLLGLAHDANFEDTDGHTVRMVNFVSAVAQMFSPRYIHPSTGSCLENVSAIAQAVKMQAKSDRAEKIRKHSIVDGHSVTPSSSSGHSGSTSALVNHECGATCVMKYGIADGPVTAGVLAGKCPAFDVLGSTVNLAARMKATGQPFKVHCSESVYRRVSRNPKSPYDWEKPHSTYAKGFGNINTYFIRGSKTVPPKDLLQKLNLEPYLGYLNYELMFSVGKAN